MGSLDTGTVRSALASQDYPGVIAEVRAAFDADPVAAMADSAVRAWIARRYRNLFLDEATASPDAVKHSQRPFPLRIADRRDERQRVADRMFRRIDASEIHDEMPKATPGAFADTTLVFVPGLITGYMPSLAFQSVFPEMVERYGVRILASDNHPVRSCEANVADLTNAMDHGIGIDSDPDGTPITADDDPTPPGDVVLMGYSKGGPDISTFLAARPEIAPRVRAVVSWAGAHGGSYLANGMYAKVEHVPDVELAKTTTDRLGEVAAHVVPFTGFQRVDRRLPEYDIKGALKSLTTQRRDEFNAANTALLDSLGIPTFYVTGSTSVREVAYFNAAGVIQLDRYDSNNDMQLTQDEATPRTANAVHLAMFHANHWDLSYDTWPWYKTLGSFELREPFTRYCALSSILLLLDELGPMR